MIALLIPRFLGFARAVPMWAWALAAVLGWGMYQKHHATTVAASFQAAQAEAAHDRQAALEANIAETSRRLTVQQEIAHAADLAASQARADADSAGAAAGGLRARIAALQASARASNPAAAGPSETDRLADVLTQCADRYASVAAAADRAVIAGNACQAAYGSLSK